MQLTAKQSRGLPVGPTSSIVLAESCLDDVDKHLLSRGYVHARYVDDFRIFCRSAKEAVRGIHDLTEYLFTAHRLSLQSSKTRILSATDFCSEELYEPEEMENSTIQDRLQEFLAEIKELSGYAYEIDEIDDETRQKTIRTSLKELFDDAINADPVPFGVVRHLLRRAAHLRVRNIYSNVFANLGTLVPVFRDVALYLRATFPATDNKAWGAQFLRFLKEDEFGEVPFVRMWALDVFQALPQLAGYESSLEIASSGGDADSIRSKALLAIAHNRLEFIRAYKESWRALGAWDRRAIIWAGQMLPTSERRSWLDSVIDDCDLLEKSIAGYVRGLVPQGGARTARKKKKKKTG